MSNRVGLLLPRSVIYPTMSFDMMAGLKIGLADNGINDADIRTEGIGIASDDKLIYAACEKLLFDGCTIVTGYVNPVTTEKLDPLFAGANAVFLALDAGYHYPSSMKKLPHVFTISLQGTLCCRVMASTAVSEGGKNFAFTCSFYDAGYRAPHGFRQGIENGGGELNFNHITKLKRADFTLEPLATHLKEHATDAVLAAFCGDMLQDFFAAASEGNVFENHAVYGSAFTGDEQWLAQSVYPGVDIKTCVTWAGGLDNAANNHFMKMIAEKKQRANIFSVLGWEAGIVMAAALNRGEVDALSLEGLQLNSPRGHVVLDADSHQAHAPVYEALVKSGADGKCVLAVVKESLLTDQQRKKQEEDINNFTGPSTSWQNAYGCLDT